ncbi:inner membrane protein yqaA [Rheinheimera nanhaiensis E407-8]|uniref:Inner membrane protein yqaA n=2 Tax=Rheinheimera TaxID=67575 RepID=I1E2Z0_9GAMM|nr:inner membrane protein yqaA [Rheinheimera nanhaiensis E407-8]
MAYLSLFFSGFIAATLFPASSEVLLLVLQAQGYSVLWLLVAATAGNTLGSCVNWYLGTCLLDFQHKRWFPVSATALSRAQLQFQRYGSWCLLLAWLPVVGDPLTLVAGVLKMRFRLFLPLVLLGKAARYALLLAAGSAWFA